MVCFLAKPAGVYRPRSTTETDFHRLIRQNFAVFRAVYAQRYAHKFGFWRPVFDKAAREFLKCGDLHEGFARVRCPDCRHEFFVAFSCKQRCICPSCSQKRTILLGLHVANDVCLSIPHRQFVWTIPKRLRIFFRFHRRLLHQLPGLAWQSIREVYASLLGPGVAPGGILAVQTFGQLLHFHPHIHGLVTDGAFTPDGRFIPLPQNLAHQPFLRLWEDKVFALLLDAKKIDAALVEQLRSWRHSGFNVDRSVRLEAGDRDGIERLAQYMGRSPFSLARVVRITKTGQVIYRSEKDSPKRYHDPDGGKPLAEVRRNFQVFQPLDFLAELYQHTPNKGEHLIRYYGFYSSRARGKRGLARCAVGGVPASSSAATEGPDSTPAPPTQSAAPPAPKARRRWAMLIHHVYQADPLLRPHCGGRMKIIAFIEARQRDIIRKILEHCGLWQDSPARAPPLLSGPLEHPKSGAPAHDPDSRITHEPDPDFAEHLRREQQEQPELPWDP